MRVGNTTYFFRRCVPKLESFENEIFRKCNLLKLVFFFSTSPSTNPISQIQLQTFTISFLSSFSSPVLILKSLLSLRSVHHHSLYYLSLIVSHSFSIYISSSLHSSALYNFSALVFPFIHLTFPPDNKKKHNQTRYKPAKHIQVFAYRTQTRNQPNVPNAQHTHTVLPRKPTVGKHTHIKNIHQEKVKKLQTHQLLFNSKKFFGECCNRYQRSYITFFGLKLYTYRGSRVQEEKTQEQQLQYSSCSEFLLLPTDTGKNT